MIRRTERGAFARWWWTVDRLLFGTLISLIVVGVIFSFAGSPPVALRYNVEPWYFVKRQIVFAFLATGVLFYFSFANLRKVRRWAIVVFLVSLVLMVFVLVGGDATKGATRWVRIAGYTLQPSEFLKPALVIVLAWLIAEWPKRKRLPVVPIHIAIMASVVVLLVLQPDVGQIVLIGATWSAMIFFAGLRTRWIIFLVGLLIVGATSAYIAFPHVSNRINQFVDPANNDAYQVEKAYSALESGGWLGEGVGEGRFTRRIPDSHTDFIYAVVAEEYGIAAAIVLILAYLLVIFKTFAYAFRARDPFLQLSLAGLGTLIGLQAVVNIGVNLSLLPPTGMTLPFISYGGSSMLATALLGGFLLAMAKKHAHEH